MTSASPMERLAHGAALTGYFGLIILTLIWETRWAPSSYAPPVVWLAIKAVPLLFPLRGMLHGRIYTYAWASMLSLAYLAEGVVLVYADAAQRLPALLEVLLASAMFAGCNVYVRHKARRLRSAVPT
ncbi:DUF2069 domain-containing protein [Thermithiobacillus plumbiphilus]|uniref:DUF2069 domain-containing protein n=1 Tax=Thermithiobacillus plumbiphilus TaxID=1729899 RepID=A0ABU9D769_9PROT